jgi:hypothetical protein
MAAMQTPTLQQAFDAATTTQAKAVVIPFATRHPMAIKESPPGQDSTILHQIVLAGNVLVFRELIKIPGVWFPLDFKDRSGRTLRNVNETAPEGSGKRNMEVYLNFLKEWDDHCELAKNYIHSENEKVWAWLRRNSLHCYTTPPSRKWSIAMQVVFYGNVELFELLLNMCSRSSSALRTPSNRRQSYILLWSSYAVVIYSTALLRKGNIRRNRLASS